MQGFVEFSEEKKITVKTKMGGEIPATIKVTGKDYHIVKTASGKQYKVDHQGNSLEEEIELSEEQLDELSKTTLKSYAKKANASQKAAGDKMDSHHAIYGDGDKQKFSKAQDTHYKRAMGLGKLSKRGVNPFQEDADDKDLPFTPDKKKTKPSTPGKYGDAYSTVRNLARKALDKQAKKSVKEESEELDERNKANALKRKTMDAARGSMYRTRTGVNLDPKTDGYPSQQALNKALGRALRKEEVEMDEGWYQKASPSYARTRHGQDLNKKAEDEHYDKQTPKMQDAINRHLRTGKSYKDAVTAASKHVKEETVDEGYPGSLSKSDYTPGAVRHDLSNIKSKKQEPQRDRPVADIDPDWEKEQAAKRKKQGVTEGYRGNSEADKPFFDAKDHKTAAEKAHKKGDHFSYHMHMAAHHDSMSHWNANKGRRHVADLHMSKAENHEHYAQQARKESK